VQRKSSKFFLGLSVFVWVACSHQGESHQSSPSKSFTEIKVQALDRDGKFFERIVRGLTAGTYQHELDHLQGKLYVDHVKDTKTLTTWQDFERYHQQDFVVRAKELVARYGG
jgi:peptide deformylase